MARKRIDTSGNANPLSNNPFAGLDGAGLPSGPAASPVPEPASRPAEGGRGRPNKKRGRVDVIRQKAGRGGKTVTVLKGFKGISSQELQELARRIQRSCGVGGTVKGGTIEIQGDQRDRAMAALEEAGFQPVRAGG